MTSNDWRIFPIPVPPLPEQQRIVGILDEAFEGIATAKANAEKNLQNARALFESHLQSVFTHAVKDGRRRKSERFRSTRSAKCSTRRKIGDIYNHTWRNINVRWFSFDLSDLLQMPFQPEEQDKYTAIEGDVLACEGGYPGRAAIGARRIPYTSKRRCIEFAFTSQAITNGSCTTYTHKIRVANSRPTSAAPGSSISPGKS